MPELTPGIVTEVVAACTAGADEIAAAFRRGLDSDVKVSAGAPGTLRMESLPEGVSESGLVAVLTVGKSAALLLVPGSQGMVPTWCNEPDATGQSRLTTLAQELGMLLLPEAYMPDDFKAGVVKSLHGALARAGIASGAALVPLELDRGSGKTTAFLVWPASKPGGVFSKPAPSPLSPIPSSAPPAAKVAKPPQPASPARNRAAAVGDLPPYARSLLRIKVPVAVTLAEKRQPLGWIVELGPGSIIQFDKSCEEMLELDVGGRRVATGEAVKVGDKFGLRVTSISLPNERFNPVAPGAKR